MVSCLLIENNPEERQRIHAMLETLGIDVEMRAAASDALGFCREQRPQLIIMEATAQPATKEILRLAGYGMGSRNGHGSPVVILYTDHPNMDDMGASILAGASDFLIKPFDERLLHFKLEQAGVLAH